MTDDPQLATLVALADRAIADLDGADDVALARRAAALGRRRLRTRTTLRTAGALVAASALTVAGVQLFPDQLARVPFVRDLVPAPAAQQPVKSGGYDPYAHLMAERTRGPLAGDDTFARRAFQAWATAGDVSVDRDRGIFDDLRGDPHLVWAGLTSTGPAAVVVQRAYLHPHDDLSPEHTGPQTLIGYVTTGPDGSLRLAADDYGSDDGHGSLAPGRPSGLVGTWLDLPHRVLWLVDPGYPLVYSTAWSYRGDGAVTRDWQPVDFQEGAVSIDLPDDVDPRLVQVARTPVTDQWDLQRVAGYELVPEQDLPDVAWGGRAGCLDAARPGTEAPAPSPLTCVDWVTALQAAREKVTAPGWQMNGSGGAVLGRAPDGRRVVVAVLTIDYQPPRVVAGLLGGQAPEDVTSAALVDAGPIDPKAPLPVAVRLPDAQGWVVATLGATLRYRTVPSAAWRAAGADAALLPDADSLQVEVTPAGGRPTVVDLGG